MERLAKRVTLRDTGSSFPNISWVPGTTPLRSCLNSEVGWWGTGILRTACQRYSGAGCPLLIQWQGNGATRDHGRWRSPSSPPERSRPLCTAWRDARPQRAARHHLQRSPKPLDPGAKCRRWNTRNPWKPRRPSACGPASRQRERKRPAEMPSSRGTLPHL